MCGTCSRASVRWVCTRLKALHASSAPLLMMPAGIADNNSLQAVVAFSV